jgi:hypothetical protein
MCAGIPAPHGAPGPCGAGEYLLGAFTVIGNNVYCVVYDEARILDRQIVALECVDDRPVC